MIEVAELAFATDGRDSNSVLLSDTSHFDSKATETSNPVPASRKTKSYTLNLKPKPYNEHGAFEPTN